MLPVEVDNAEVGAGGGRIQQTTARHCQRYTGGVEYCGGRDEPKTRRHYAGCAPNIERVVPGASVRRDLEVKIVVAAEANFGAAREGVLIKKGRGIRCARLVYLYAHIAGAARTGRDFIEENIVGGNAQRIAQIGGGADAERGELPVASGRHNLREFRRRKAACRRAILNDKAIVRRIDGDLALRASEGRDLHGGSAPKLQLLAHPTVPRSIASTMAPAPTVPKSSAIATASLACPRSVGRPEASCAAIGSADPPPEGENE